VFVLRGLCDRSPGSNQQPDLQFRTGFDTEYMVTNDQATGLISYIGP
jgi:hypothetical protein